MRVEAKAATNVKQTVPMKQRIQTLIGLLLTLGVMNLPLGNWGGRLDLFGALLSRECLSWLAVAILLVYVLFVERRTLSSIGFRKLRPLDILLAIAAGIVMIVGIGVTYSIVFPMLHLHMNAVEMKSLLATPFWFRLLLVTRAAVVEETLFRGYPIERIDELTGSRWLAGAISLVAFTIAHLRGWGWAQLIVAGFGGLVLTALYLWRRNTGATMIAHWVADGAGFLLGH